MNACSNLILKILVRKPARNPRKTFAALPSLFSPNPLSGYVKYVDAGVDFLFFENENAANIHRSVVSVDAKINLI